MRCYYSISQPHFRGLRDALQSMTTLEKEATFHLVPKSNKQTIRSLGQENLISNTLDNAQLTFYDFSFSLWL